ncbi:MAG TPA: hypothetical protein VFW07_08450 [Parafilimonas sp.]|nr:hypothetical protein [Parafilimonas sp.]
MNKTPDTLLTGNLAVRDELKRPITHTRRAGYFFVFMAILFPVITFLGFYPSYRDFEAGTLKIHWLTHIHSTVMTSWLLLYLTQTLLAATGSIKIHRRLGPLAFVLGILVFVFMGIVTFHILIVNHPPEGSFLFSLLIGNFFEVLSFALFFTWGMLLRKKKTAAHKRLITLASITLLVAGVDRMRLNDLLPSLGMEGFATFIYVDILLIPLFLYDLITLRRIHKFTLIGTAILIFLQVISTNVSNSPSWHKFWFEATAPLMEKVVEIKLTDEQSLPLLGDYESTVGKITISRNNDTLYVQFDGGEKAELGATSATELFMKGDVWTFSFTKGVDGQVAAAEAKLIGRTYTMAKVK